MSLRCSKQRLTMRARPQLAFSSSSLGNVRSEILRAFSFEEMSRILGKMV
jgi:uncharacterized protein with GYD domain